MELKDVLDQLAAQGIYVVFPPREIWPFSQYHMYSSVLAGGTGTQLGIIGVAPDGTERTLRRSELFHPLDMVRIRAGLSWMLENPDDAGGWLLLAQSYRHLNRADEARDAYAAAVKLGRSDANLEAWLAGHAIGDPEMRVVKQWIESETPEDE